MCEFFLDGCTGLAEKRERLQQHIDGLEPKIRRRLRGKFLVLNHGAYDLDDVLSSMRRRADLMMVEERIRACTNNEVDALLHRIAERLALDVVRGSHISPIDDSIAADIPAKDRQQSSEQAEFVNRAFEQMTDNERVTIQLWATDCCQTTVAEATDVNVEAQRSRWRRMKKRLRSLWTR